MSVWEKKIPGLLGLILIVAGIAATSYLVQTGAKLFSHASPSELPKDYRITNVTDSSFTVTYRTDTPVIGTLSFGKIDTTEQIVLDERDLPTGKPQPYTVHSITVRNLQPQTNYMFSITSGSSTFLNNDKPFTVTTGPKLSDQPLNQGPLAGNIVLSDGTKPQEAIVIMTAPNAQLISALVKSNGTYALPLNTLRTADLLHLDTLASSQSQQLIVFTNSLVSHIILPVGQNTVPAITLGSDYDFSTSQTTPLATSEAQALDVKFPKFAVDSSVNVTEKITTPKDGDSFTDQQPTFQGTAQPNSTVTVEIHSTDVITQTVSTDALGNWSFRPTQKLSPGQHTITITTTGPDGILKKITNSFTVYAAGTQVTQPATPSATLTPTKVPTATPSPTKIPTVTITIAPSPTTVVTQAPTVTILPTQIITPTTPITPTTKGGLPATGPADTMIIGMVGAATTIIGIILFVATKAAPL